MEQVTKQATELTKADRDQLVTDYLPLVRSVVRRMAVTAPAGVFDFEDLVSYGIIGLMNAAERYDGDRGTPFASYAAIRIRGAVIDALRDADPLSRQARQRARHLNVIESRIELESGRRPTQDEMVRESGLTEAQYIEATRAAGYTCVSLDTMLASSSDGEEGPMREVAADVDDDPGGIEHKELLEELVKAIAELPERDRQVIGLRYQEDRTLQEVADILHISPSRVSQIHSRIVNKLRANLGRVYGDAA
jgi:RNA polymerase sigma factor FliA